MHGGSSVITTFDELIEAWVEMLENFSRLLGIDWLFKPMIKTWQTEPIATPSVPVELTEHGGIEL